MFSFQHAIFEIQSVFYTDNTSQFVRATFQLFSSHVWLVFALLDNTDIGFDSSLKELWLLPWVIWEAFQFQELKCHDLIYVLKTSGLALTENTPKGIKHRNRETRYSNLDEEWRWLRGYQWMP